MMPHSLDFFSSFEEQIFETSINEPFMDGNYLR